ncbi:MAG: hypothetical protein AMK69_19465 [Nitrospira bacterium SG8_3]|nr:MAG: hypothetical protein AMK69_19465 [Nitrospira bacterium SG8_3]
MKPRNIIRTAGLSCYFIFIVLSFALGFSPGKAIGYNLFSFSLDMLKVLPCAFILIGLFEVWVKRETVEKHFGEEAGIKGYIWAVLLAGTIVGPLYVALPLAYSLHRKGARLGVIFTYIGASAICRIPMAIFEVSFLGLKFTAIRFLVSIPLVILSSKILGEYLSKGGYQISDGTQVTTE